MTAAKPTPDTPRWDKLHAPKVSRSHVIAAASIYAVWIAFLAYLAVSRWYGTLQ